MTNQELLAFLEWVRSRYVLARIEVRKEGPFNISRRSLVVESIANQALYRPVQERE